MAGETMDGDHGRPIQRMQHMDSLRVDAERVSTAGFHAAQGGWMKTLLLAFQSIGVIYGDIGTSPLYVYSSTFPNGIEHPDDVLGALSLILYTLILIPMIKYVFIVLYANDNGDGGTFALYSLISRYAKVSLIPNQQAEDAMVSNYHLETPSPKLRRAHWIKEKLETSTVSKVVLFLLAILGTSMVIGDGILTPSISVLSAVGGLTQKASLSQTQIVWISVAILVVLFAAQRFGTDKVGYSFAPIIAVWFFFIGVIGMYNMIKHDAGVLRAFNPKYIVDYFKRNGRKGWISLGGIVLCITGTEAMFADLGHFNIRAIQISFSFVLFPAVSLAYIGQAAYLRKFPGDVAYSFYKSIPNALFWPQFIIAVLAAIIASQAMISGAFSIISQSQTLACFPRVKVIHTSKKYQGQVYIPEVNFVLGLGTIVVTLAYRTTTKIGNAYGIAVLFVMTITTLMLILIMLMIWQTNFIWVILFFVVFGLTELVYLSSVLYKFIEGGYLPLAVALLLVIIMTVWHYVHVKKYWYELENKVSAESLVEMMQKCDLKRIPGVGFLYTELVQGTPPIFTRLVQKIPYVHSVLVFISIKHLPIPRVDRDERFLFRHVEPKNMHLYRCVARYGYNDHPEETEDFAAMLVEGLRRHVKDQHLYQAVNNRSNCQELSSTVGLEEEMEFIEREMENGVVYLMGESEVAAARNSSAVKKIVVNIIYSFLKKNFRQGEKVLSIPHDQLLKVGMTYEI